MSGDERDKPGEGMNALVVEAAALGFSLDVAQVERFARYRALLLDWNTRVNLTSITDPAEVVTRHFLDSLTCVLALPTEWRERGITLIDVGSGAGFPGLPLAIALPNWQVTLLEATGKKVRFLEAVVAELGLANVESVTGRAEEVAHRPEYRGRFDVVTARALAVLHTLLEYCCPFARTGGYVVAPKKGDLAEEVAVGGRAANLLGAKLLAPEPITLPGLADGRVLVVARQERPCPPQYPRAAGAPVKRPVGM
jgi:16S rRNA (guanine527-N7)-methyltransferase